jgi:Leucine-rich repeat (LRR) protein
MIDRLPVEVGTVVTLRLLELEDNRLKVLPEAFSGLLHLKVLKLNRNQIKDFPQPIRSSIRSVSELLHLLICCC